MSNALTTTQGFSESSQQFAVVETASCVIVGCINPVRVKQTVLCNMHDKRKRKYGDAGEPERRKTVNGIGSLLKSGFIQIYEEGKIKHQHVIIAEKALGKKLPRGAAAHHVDENKSNNTPSNLVICQDEAYHRLLHIRTRALEASGNANYRKCPYCKAYDATENLTHNKSCGYWFHPSCSNEYKRNKRAAKKGIQQ